MADDELDVYELLGLAETTRPNTPEEDFYARITSGSSSRMDNMLYFLKHEIEHFKWLKENGIGLYKKVWVRDELTHLCSTNVFITNEDYIRLMVKYYLQMMHLTRFVYNTHDEEGVAHPKIDLDKTVALFMQYEGVKKIVNQPDIKD